MLRRNWPGLFAIVDHVAHQHGLGPHEVAHAHGGLFIHHAAQAQALFFEDALQVLAVHHLQERVIGLGEGGHGIGLHLGGHFLTTSSGREGEHGNGILTLGQRLAAERGSILVGGILLHNTVQFIVCLAVTTGLKVRLACTVEGLQIRYALQAAGILVVGFQLGDTRENSFGCLEIRLGHERLTLVVKFNEILALHLLEIGPVMVGDLQQHTESLLRAPGSSWHLGRRPRPLLWKSPCSPHGRRR